MMKYFIIVGSVLVIAFSSCVKDKALEPVVVVPGACEDTVSFSAVIMPQIIDVSCNTSGCHNPSGGAAGYVLSNYDQVSTNANIIFSVINHESGVTPMPYVQPKLADSLIQKFDCWMEQGLLDN